MRQDVRILLVGESQVGKTSLVLSLVSEEFPEEVPPKAEEITIPADVTPEKVPTHLVDYSSQEQDEFTLREEIVKANVICIVYAVNAEDTIKKITSYWLPLIRDSLQADSTRPVILVGNKSDLLDVSSMESILPIMNQYAEVETCVECSAKTLKNISEVFYYAQKAVLHPTAPLYKPNEKELTADCEEALYRIFRICDQDNDDILNDKEIYQFQRRCFNVPLQPQALEDVKAVVRKHIEHGIECDGITRKGFVFLHTLFIQRGRHETTWTVLRKFGYDDNLKLNRLYLFPQLDVPMTCTTELTYEGFQFLTSLFNKYDEDKDGCLSPTELSNLFSTCPKMPWCPNVSNSVVTNEQGWIKRQGFLSNWVLTTLRDVTQTLETLAYLGYMYEHDSQLSAVHVTREKRFDLERRQTNRTAFMCKVFGQASCGKTVFLQGLLNRNLKYVATLDQKRLPKYTCNYVQVYCQDNYLVLHEMNVQDKDTINTRFSADCDVICLLYDVTNPRSFEYCATLYEKSLASSGIPVLLVGTRGEQRPVLQDYHTQPVQFCSKHRLPPPQMYSCLSDINSDIYYRLTTMAAYPNVSAFGLLLCRPPGVWLHENIRHLRGLTHSDSSTWLKVGLGLAVVSIVCFSTYKYMKSR